MRQFGALLLLFLWPVLSSHATLELAGCIHVHCDDHHSGEPHPCPEPPHAAAEGDYFGRTSTSLPGTPSQMDVPSPPPPVHPPPLPSQPWAGSLSIPFRARHGPAPPQEFLLLNVPSWLLVQRIALSPRAP